MTIWSLIFFICTDEVSAVGRTPTDHTQTCGVRQARFKNYQTAMEKYKTLVSKNVVAKSWSHRRGTPVPGRPSAPNVAPRRYRVEIKRSNNMLCCEAFHEPFLHSWSKFYRKMRHRVPPFWPAAQSTPARPMSQANPVGWFWYEKISDDVKSRNWFRFWFCKKICQEPIDHMGYAHKDARIAPWRRWNLHLIAYDHTTMNTPVLVWSRKLSIVGPR